MVPKISGVNYERRVLGEFRSKYEKTVKVTGKVSENAKKSIDG